MRHEYPLVSFIVSVYNLEGYIGQCLDSILNQPFDDYELILVNNNSSDGSDAICRDYAARYEQIRYYALTGEPVIGKALLYGLEQVRGKYIHVVDGDDLLSPGVYGEIGEVLGKNAPDIIFGRFATFSEGNVLNFTDRAYQQERINGRSKDQVLQYLAENQPFILAQWRLIVSKETMFLKWKDRHSYSEHKFANTHMDVYNSLRSLVAARSIYYIDKDIYRYRVRSSSISRINISVQISECARILMALSNVLETVCDTDQERSFVQVYMEQFRYQFVAALCALEESDFAACVSNVEQSYINEASRWHTDIKRGNYPFVYDLICNGVEAGLAKCQKEYLGKLKKIAENIALCQRSIYIAPTGNIGLYIKTAFEKNGLEISGFFDNDEKKEGLVIEGAPIHLPASAAQISARTPIGIIIASRYKNVREELMEQFLSLGINENDLFTVNF